MRMAIVAILLAFVCQLNVGCDGCDKNGDDNDDDTDTTTTTTITSSTTCNATTCNVSVYINDSCQPETVDHALTMLTNADPGATMCFFNQATSSVTLTIPAGLIAGGTPDGAPYRDYTLANGECVSIQITATEDTYSYQVTGCASSAGSGNPEVKVGGGGEG